MAGDDRPLAPPHRLRIGIIVDRQTLARWQLEALRELVGDADLLVYSCNNTTAGPRRLGHALYYLLNLFTIRNKTTRRGPWPADLPKVALYEFDAPQAGIWQEFPRDVLDRLQSDRVDVLVKFGMGLLRVPPASELSIPIISYHHGDPATYRGRPAGFYEMLAGAPVIGQVVQRLSNSLDAGEIVAFAETKIAAHSYRCTLIEAYRQSPLILRQAISNCLEGRSWKPRHWGTNFRLPSNAMVLRFLLKQWRRVMARLFYGLFKEKRCNVAMVAIGDDASLDPVVEALSQVAKWQIAQTPKGYRFLADPFFHPDGGLLVEGFNSRSCRGEILQLDAGRVRRLSGNGGHYSYPTTHFDGAQWNLIPEISEWSSAKAFALCGDRLGEPAEVRIAGRPRLLDPTPFHHDGILYLFANLAEEGPSVLRLWIAESLRDQFAEHPSSPVRLSPHGSRMAGNIFRTGASLIRVGQDLRRGYGDGLSFFCITQVDPHRYEEEHIRDFRFDHRRGPHTLNFNNGCAAFDFYDEPTTLFAGIRRLRERRAARTSD